MAVAVADIQRFEVGEAPNSIGVGVAVLLGTALAVLAIGLHSIGNIWGPGT